MDRELLAAICSMLDQKLTEQLEPIRQDITGLKQDMTGVKQDITGLDQKVTELQKQNDLISSGVIKIKDEVRVRGDAYLDIKLEVIGLRKSQERVEVVLDRVDAMSKVVQKAHQNHEDHEARIRALEGRVTA